MAKPKLSTPVRLILGMFLSTLGWLVLAGMIFFGMTEKRLVKKAEMAADR
jgi:hypothetical protein